MEKCRSPARFGSGVDFPAVCLVDLARGWEKSSERDSRFFFLEVVLGREGTQGGGRIGKGRRVLLMELLGYCLVLSQFPSSLGMRLVGISCGLLKMTLLLCCQERGPLYFEQLQVGRFDPGPRMADFASFGAGDLASGART